MRYGSARPSPVRPARPRYSLAGRPITALRGQGQASEAGLARSRGANVHELHTSLQHWITSSGESFSLCANFRCGETWSFVELRGNLNLLWRTTN